MVSPRWGEMSIALDATPRRNVVRRAEPNLAVGSSSPKIDQHHVTGH